MSLGILCPGQGGQHAKMFANLFDLEQARPILKLVAELTNVDLRNLKDQEDSGFLTENRIAQVLVVGQTLALRAVLDGLPKTGLIVAGYSVGDLAAHSIAGSLSITDTLTLAQARARAMDRAAARANLELGMTGVRGMSVTQIEILTHDTGIEIALINGVDHFVLGGPRAALEGFESLARQKGGHIKRLPVSIASHTSYLSGAGAELEAALQGCDWRRPVRRLLSPVDGSAVTTKHQAVASLTRQIAVPLDWASTMLAMREYGVTATLELGSGRALTKIIEETMPDVTARAADDFKTIAGLSRWIAGWSA